MDFHAFLELPHSSTYQSQAGANGFGTNAAYAEVRVIGMGGYISSAENPVNSIHMLNFRGPVVMAVGERIRRIEYQQDVRGDMY
jgi:hypothetical protein